MNFDKTNKLEISILWKTIEALDNSNNDCKQFLSEKYCLLQKRTACLKEDSSRSLTLMSNYSIREFAALDQQLSKKITSLLIPDLT